MDGKIAAPEAFKKYPQFILWRAVNGTKLPVDYRTMNTGDAHDTGAHLDYETAAGLAKMYGYGLGFVFTEADPFFYIDIDHAFTDGQWSQVATLLCQQFSGCAVEVSISGTGLHIFGIGQVPPHGCKNILLGLELYTDRRFVALTGTGLSGDAGCAPAPATLSWLVDSYFPAGETVAPAEWTYGPCEGWAGPVDDLQLIERMLASRSTSSIFGGRATPAMLWAADPAIGQVFPHEINGFDHSSADAALCAHLAFWTGRDCERMDRIFRMSGLYRDKWEHREDYRRRTILGAVSRCKSTLGAAPAPTNGTPVPALVGEGFKTGLQYLTVTQQQELFKGCVYIRDMHKVLTADGALLKPEQFKAMYGGYVFALDAMNVKTTRNAWEVFTESQAINFPKSFGACFRPENPPGAIITEEGGTMVNIYIPAVVERKKGDATRFLDHLAKLLPNDRDRLILLSYMAACVQHIGVKFQWCPLLQGIEGNGKTLLANCIAKAVGWKYTHTPNANDLSNKFNQWILGKLLILVEEIYANDRKEAVETLKPLITNPIIEIQGKGTNQLTGDNRANFFMCTNHKDAIRKTRTDRRYCVFYTDQQKDSDLRRCGMGGNYFPSLYEWLRREGYAIVTDYLMTYKISDEFNPAKRCHRAPITSSTDEAYILSAGGLEQEIFEAIEQGKYGFAKGWISSLAFLHLIKERKDEKRIPPNKRREIIGELGYVAHPGLVGGRVNNIIPKEDGKPILYIKHGHESTVLSKPADIARAYLADQEG